MLESEEGIPEERASVQEPQILGIHFADSRNSKQFGERLREERRDQNLTYAALARELNLDRSHIYYLEARNKYVDNQLRIHSVKQISIIHKLCVVSYSNAHQ